MHILGGFMNDIRGDLRGTWLVIVKTKKGEEHSLIQDRFVRIWGGNSIPKKGEIIPISIEKGKEHSKVTNIDSKEKKIWLKGVKE